MESEYKKQIRLLILKFDKQVNDINKIIDELREISKHQNTDDKTII